MTGHPKFKTSHMANFIPSYTMNRQGPQNSFFCLNKLDVRCESYVIWRSPNFMSHWSNRLDILVRLVEVVRHCRTCPTIRANFLESDNFIRPCPTSLTMEHANSLKNNNLG
jgi:hypothetical protein